ncbi:acyl carrier protein, partial [Amycolatopsis sp. NPDC059027]|uniref:acyl carrier protein n=1 Tax=Amycolatopsis sp. NPDC059027 TaxID=3346709 RepID=UPI00366F78D5
MTRAQLRHWLAGRLAEICGLPVSDVDVDRPLREYGLTSRDAVTLTGELEDELDRELPTQLLWQHPTITALAAALVPEPEGETWGGNDAGGGGGGDAPPRGVGRVVVGDPGVDGGPLNHP